jgi:8-oxo-dGTP diphosphatase
MKNVNYIQVTAAILKKDGKILIGKRDKNDPLKDKWEFPGGKVEANETPEACLKRELEEELGVVTEIGEFLCSSKHEYSHIAIELLVYRAYHVSGQFEAHDHTEIRWVVPKDLGNYDFPEADIPIVEMLMNGK